MTPSDAPIAAVVVSYRSAETIDECLDRLQASDGVAEIRVVDNGSDDGTLEIVQRHAARDPRVRFIANPDNPGFAVACNQGAGDSQSPWLAFVNPDCLLEPDALARLRTWARSLEMPLIGADLVDEDGVRDAAARRRDPDFGSMLHGLLAGTFLRRSTAHVMAVPPDDATELQPVQAVSGALMLMPRTLFERIGGFDEGYRLHAEDLDLCRRAREAGAQLAVANRVRVLHLRGVSSRSRPFFVEWHKHRGLARYFRRFEASRLRLPTRMAVLTAIWLRYPFAVARAALRR
ncbi:glycosyltransferase family 2 protein [Lysobacter sp. SG-8]|uniref:Glycosyltransferase family 2 protein n=1 Tax=Marilutibacter penaei TaxID=2759900 RepID=A0A7W3U3K7_9GAMM|nr:glycosyltransferase family 2 protein [Lysobacter penaei]MBB1088010.1 glycosyltransferase family 2 protein [Lysobacter penaei]